MAEKSLKSRVLVCDPINQAGIDLLKEHFTVDVMPGLTRDELLNTVHMYDAIVVKSATQINSLVIERAPRLKVIGRAGSGLDNIALNTAKKRGIIVINSPDANSVAVAELTMSMILSLARQLPRADQSMKNGKWEKNKLMGISLVGKKLGIVGFGRIGREVALRAQAFGMTVLVYQRHQTSNPNTFMKVQHVRLKDIYRNADFISLHVPKSPQTNGLIGENEIALMKPSAYLINTSRGSVVDETALLKALDTGLIAGAGLDVYEKEPAIDHQLAKHPKALATPHIAASTKDAQHAAAITIAQKISEILLDQPIKKNPLSLRVVDLKSVSKHENIDRKRVGKLKKRITKETVFTNPPIVVEDNGRFIVLDGATRTTAFKEMGFEHIIVQLLENENNFALDTWFHAIRKVNPAHIVKRLKKLSEVSLVESRTGKVLEEMTDHGGLCYLITLDGKIYHIQPAGGANHLEALNKLTRTYIDASYVSRCTDCDIKTLIHKFPDFAALVIFPKYEIEQVLQIARAKKALPAGITRFLISGRVMRLNADLEYLRSDKSLSEKNEWLYNLTMERLAGDRVRYYHEPVYLMDE